MATGFQPTIRLRLTLVYGGMFLAAGAVLLALNYALVQRSLHRETGPVGITMEPYLGGPAPGEINFVRPAPSPGVVVTPDGQRLGEVLARFEERLRDEALHELVVQSSLALGVMALASVGLGWMLAGRVLRPLQDMTAAARRLSETNLHERLALPGPADELKELADTFDAMLERLESAFEAQRRFVANASHELRTPLAVQRTLVDVALADPAASVEDLRAMAAEVNEAVDRSEHLIEGLLLLARSQQGLGPEEPVDVAAAARAAVDHVASEAEARSITVRHDVCPAAVTGSRVLLERLVANLVQNAVRHNRDAGWLEVTTSATPAAVTVTVANSGPAISPQQVPTLFEPFRRLAPDRVESARGAGLGLSIVRAVVAAHRGSVDAQPLEGGGLRVVVTLPAGPHAGRSEPTDPVASRPNASARSS